MGCSVRIVNTSIISMTKMTIEAYLANLKADVAKWIRADEQVVVMLDANSDVRDGDVNQTFSALGMHEVFPEFNADLPSTSTFARNLKGVPINAILETPTVTLQAGGYLGFGKGPGLDDRCLWMDISYQTAFGYSPPPMGKVNARHLTCKDTSV